MSERRFLVRCSIALRHPDSDVFLELDPPPDHPRWDHAAGGSYGWTSRYDATRLTAEDAAALALQFIGTDGDQYTVEEVEDA